MMSETGMEIKPDDGKQKSMIYSSGSEDSEHSLAGGIIQCMFPCFKFRWMPISIFLL